MTILSDHKHLVIQFSTAAPVWKWWVPKGLQRPKVLCLLGDENWGSSLIRRANHSPFSHCDIEMPDGNLLGVSDSPKAPIIPTTPPGNPRGVAIRPPNYQRFAYRRQMIIHTDRANDIRAIAMTQLGKGFDNSALKDFLSDRFPGDRDWRLDDHWFCAELVVWALETGYLWEERLPWPKNRVSPTDILLVMLMDKKWLNRDTFWLPIPGLTMDPGER